MTNQSQYSVPVCAFAGSLAIFAGIHAIINNIEPAYAWAAPPWVAVVIGGITLFVAFKSARSDSC